MTGWMVVSDVDHTLLETPAEAALAGDCLRRLAERGTPTLLASSKTFAEMVALHEAAGLGPQPFVFENGAGIGWPLERWPPIVGVGPDARLGGYGSLVRGAAPGRPAALLRELRTGLGLDFEMLNELPLADIGGLLGLSEPEARLALDRAATVPLVWRDDEEALGRLRGRLAAHGLTAVRGGRLVHVGPAGGKGESLERLRPWLAECGLAAPAGVVACGDSENDRSLLEAAPVALVFHPAERPPLPLAPAPPGLRPLRRGVVAGGPRPWLAAVEAALAEAGPAPGHG